MFVKHLFHSYYTPVRPLASVSHRTLFVASIGNPEPEYANTRHSVGHRFFDYVVENWSSHLTKDGPYYTSSKYKHLVLFKSSKALMNLQGKPIAAHYKQYARDALVIIHDELQVDVGKLQVRGPGTSARGHNGLKSINSYLKNDYTKIGIGIGRPLDKSQVTDYVMSSFTRTDKEALTGAFARALAELEKLAQEHQA